tara:strand:+ start:6593 stop:6997 length:405 start_codon:yes stop_codon:yes gene_type:complete
MGRILGVDYGDRRIGLALSDLEKIIASPFKTIQNKDSLNSLATIIDEQDVESIVIGLPIGLKGQDTIQTLKVREYVKKLESFNCPIYLEDERLTSVAAQKSLIEQNLKTGHNKSIIDKRAASILLQQFLDKQKR